MQTRVSIAAALAGLALVQGTPAASWTVDRALEFRPGSAKAQALLARVPDAKEIVADRFSIASADLDDDGKAEIVVLAASSAACGSAGCRMLVLQQQERRIVTLLSATVDGTVAVTREKQGAWRALALLDDKGAIALGSRKGDANFGRPIVHTLGAAAVSAQTPAAPTEPDAKAVPAAAASAGRLDVVGVGIGMPAAQAEAAMARHNPALAIRRESFELELWGRPATAIVIGRDGTLEHANEEVAFRLSLPPGPPVVVEVLRWVSYANDASPVKRVVLDSLQRKYGPLRPTATEAHGLRHEYVLFVDAQGRPAAQPPGNCAPLTPERRWSAIKNTNDIDLAFQQIDRAVNDAARVAAACGATVTVTLHTRRDNPDLVAMFGIRVADERLVAAKLKATADHTLGLDAKRRAGAVGEAAGRKVKM